MATVTPFPIFSSTHPSGRTSPNDDGRSTSALSAVGRCRVHPLVCGGPSAASEFCGIVYKCSAQLAASNDKKASKRLMKEGVTMARKYLTETLGIDVTVVDVEIVVDCRDLIDTGGLFASCLLDAGCDRIVVDAGVGPPLSPTRRSIGVPGGSPKTAEALDAARVPRERIVARYGAGAVPPSASEMEDVCELAGTVSVRLSDAASSGEASEAAEVWKELMVEGTEMVLELDPNVMDDAGIGEVSKALAGRGGIALVDPTAEQLGMGYAACIRTDREDKLYTTVVVTRSNEALGLVYSSKSSIVAALQCGRGVYYSRSRGGLWRKGDTSGHYQTLHRIDVDCDGDALRFTVTQRGDDCAAFCHLNTLTCWGRPRGLRHLEETLADRLKDAPEGSYTKRLFDDDALLRDKLVEEAQELSEATERKHVAEELADVLYFAMVRAAKAGVSIDDAAAELDRRARKVTRRKGDSKPERIKAGEAILAGKKE